MNMIFRSDWHPRLIYASTISFMHRYYLHYELIKVNIQAHNRMEPKYSKFKETARKYLNVRLCFVGKVQSWHSNETIKYGIPKKIQYLKKSSISSYTINIVAYHFRAPNCSCLDMPIPGRTASFLRQYDRWILQRQERAFSKRCLRSGISNHIHTAIQSVQFCRFGLTCEPRQRLGISSRGLEDIPSVRHTLSQWLGLGKPMHVEEHSFWNETANIL